VILENISGGGKLALVFMGTDQIHQRAWNSEEHFQDIQSKQKEEASKKGIHHANWMKGKKFIQQSLHQGMAPLGGKGHLATREASQSDNEGRERNSLF